MIRRVFYQCKLWNGISFSELQKIQLRNASKNIGGYLAVNHRTMSAIQVLEGERHDIEILMQRIERDGRVAQTDYIEIKDVDTRSFGNCNFKIFTDQTH